MTRFWSIVPFMLISSAAWANASNWQDLGLITNKSSTNGLQARDASTNTASDLQQYRRMLLDEASLRSSLNQLGNKAETQSKASATSIELPLPDGSFTTVHITPTEILAPEIAALHPEIQTWQVTGTDGKTLSGVIDFTALGFRAMLDMQDGDTVFIDPQNNNGAREYAAFSKRKNTEAFRQEWSCGTHGKSSFRDLSSILPAAETTSTEGRTAAAKAGETLHTYRIAVASTAEYTSYSGGSSATYSSIVSTINRINQIYQRDLSIKLQLVSDTNTIFTNTATDGFTNDNPSAMLDENVTVLNKVIGVNNYDIGHVFGTKGGGLAYVGTVCSANKASGVTGLEKTGDTFDIDYVAHEIGHQFDADHTFNSVLGSCQSGRIERTAYEPGSGSTIMAYNGLCGSDDLQPTMGSDAMFHSASIAQIVNYSDNGTGANCGQLTSLSNSNPSANAGADYTIPARTPFLLTGFGSDADGDVLTYSWEEFDTGSSSTVSEDTGNNAMIRTKPPTSSNSRAIPDIATLITEGNQPGEALPSLSRDMTFRLAVRDGKGGYNYDDMLLNIVDTGTAFAVTSPLTTLLSAGSVNVTWNVASTDVAPISCSTVDIGISSDGNTFDALLNNTPNDGSQSVNIPTSSTSKRYIRVKCSNNLFFAVSTLTPAIASQRSTTDPTAATNNTASGGGGGSFPLTWILPGAIYGLLRRRKGRPS